VFSPGELLFPTAIAPRHEQRCWRIGATGPRVQRKRERAVSGRYLVGPGQSLAWRSWCRRALAGLSRCLARCPSRPGSRIEIRLGVRAHPDTTNRAHAPPGVRTPEPSTARL